MPQVVGGLWAITGLGRLGGNIYVEVAESMDHFEHHSQRSKMKKNALVIVLYSYINHIVPQTETEYS